MDCLNSVRIYNNNYTNCANSFFIDKKVTIRGTTKQVSLAMNLIEIRVQEAHESRIESNSDVAIKTTSELSSCNNDSNMSNNDLNPVLEQGT